MSEALKMAWKRAKIITKLQKGTTLFSYAKNDTGEERVAIGTLKDVEFRQSRPDVIRYYDEQKAGIRSFRIENFAR